MPPLPRPLAALLLLALLVVPLGARPVAQAQVTPPAQPAQAAEQLPPFTESEGAAGNNTPQTANTIGSSSATRWSQAVQGAITSSADVDYFTFTLSQPASSVTLALDNLPADYDLVLASVPLDGRAFEESEEGLEGVTQVGGTISAIGGTISAIGGTISAIGGTISAIGGTISAIGGTISAISANSGATAETIDTFLWLPGTYYVAVSGSNGAFSDKPYSLSVRVDGSGLTQPPAVPEVELRIPAPLVGGQFPVPPGDVTTLYIVNSDRMLQLYPGARTAVNTIADSLNALVSSPPSPSIVGTEYGVIINLRDLRASGTNLPAMAAFYEAWDSKAANPLAANYVARLIDNVIEAATTDGRSGPGEPAGVPATPYYLGASSTIPAISFPNVRNIVLVGGDDVIPGFRLPDLTTIANEADYLSYLQAVPGQNGVIDPNSAQGAAQRYRMITSDNPYGADKPYRFYGFPFYVPRLAVGRIVETPGDIASFLQAYTFTDFSESFSPSFNISLQRGFPGEERTQAFVSGYDFLKDQAAQVTGILSRTALLPSEINQLVNDEWTATDLGREWFDGQLEAEFSATRANTATQLSDLSLFSVNSHFDHWQVLPASNSAGNFQAARILNTSYISDSFSPDVPGAYFRASLGYSVGCHSGYNVLSRTATNGGSLAVGVDQTIYGADFAQAMNRHGGNWIGNTGYGYGTLDGVDYSERLSVLITQELARDVQVDGGAAASLAQSSIYIGQSIGDALRNAKQRYVRNAFTLTPYDYKATHIMTLYGLPYIRVQVSDPIAPPPEDPRPGVSVPSEVQAPYGPLPTAASGRLTRLITFTLALDDANDRRTTRTGTVFDFDRTDFASIEDQFVIEGKDDDTPFPQPQVRTFDNNQVGAPSLPAFAYDISAASPISPTERLEVKDVIFLGGVYGQQGNFNPQITTIVTETDAPLIDTDAEPTFGAGIGLWYPDKFFSFSSVGDSSDRRDQLVSAAAQFRTGLDGATGIIRPYSKMVFQVIYDDPGVNSSSAQQIREDEQPPVIASVKIDIRPAGQAQLAQTGQALVVVEAFDRNVDDDGVVTGGSGINPGDISGVYVGADGVSWQKVTFAKLNGNLFGATLPVSPGAVRVIVRVTDAAGNTTYYTARGSFLPPQDEYLTALPLVRR
jgi:hypothetical protein